MIPSYRTPAAATLIAGAILLVVAFLLVAIFSPAPHAVWIASDILFAIAAIVFTIGCCIYARGIGYPAVLGLIGLCFLGIFVLLRLPDHCPEDDDDF